jgi:putative ABC transport system substrate-binding protein
MKRRDFITLLGGATAWPLGARAQQKAMPTIGVLHSGSPEPYARELSGFRDGLKETGYVEGQNIATEYRWANGQYEQLSSLAADLVRRGVDAIFAAGGEPSALAAKAATSTIPILFISGGDPVKLGLVASFNQPGGNMTGVSWFTNELIGKRLELLNELVPPPGIMALLVNPGYSPLELQLANARAAAGDMSRKLLVLRASTASEIDSAFADLVQQQVKALFVASDPFFGSRREQLVSLAARRSIPASYSERAYVAIGGLMSYGTSLVATYRQVGVYVGRVLKGEKPAELPVMQPTRFDLIINLKTAKALGLDVPDKMLALADEVIE